MTTRSENLVQFDYSGDAVAQQTASVLVQLMAHLNGSHENLYLLFDPAKSELNADSTWLRALTERRPEPAPLLHGSIPPSYYPWLVSLDITHPADQALLKESISRSLQETDPAKLIAGNGRSLCGWLTSAQPARVVARQLGATAVQVLAEGGNILLRYFDPAVNTVLWPQLDAFQQQRMMGVISGWHLLDGNGQLVSRLQSASPFPHLSFSLGLSKKDQSRMAQTSVLNQALRQYRQMTRMQPRRDEVTLLTVMQQALQRTEMSPVMHTHDDKVLFALHTLCHHACIDQHPEFRYLLSLETRPADVRYRQRIADLTDQDWQRLARECDRMTPTPTEKHKDMLP